MPRIRQLPPSVVTKIAAGEVVERPASVVKELLENSIDAGSTRIDLEVERGGTEMIRVVDNGGGIDEDDVPLVFASHATSKLETADDLFEIGTLGFRGEALASIGGIAQVTLQSRQADQPSGWQTTCHGGELSEVRAWNGATGTRIEVRHLFFNTPVRRKFLRTPTTEMGHLTDVFTRVALAHTGVHLRLAHNGKTVLDVPSSANLLDRIGIFFGKKIREQVYAVDAEKGPARMFGYVADPAVERGNGKMQYVFLNGRPIRDRSLTHALQESYRGLLMTGRYAVAFLFLELPPDAVDVNVHPTKSEVRFRDGQALYSFVLHTIRDRLQREDLTSKLRAPSTLGSPHASESGQAQWMEPLPTNETAELFSQTGFPEVTISEEEPEETPLAAKREEREEHPAAAMSSANPQAGVAKAIQLYDSYLVLETPEGMLVIDQHALHERILFERLKKRIGQGPLESQRLLTPEPVELTSEQASQVLEFRGELEKLGMEVQDFGGGTVLLMSYPAIFGQRSPMQMFKHVVDFLASKDRPPTREQMLSDLMSLMACHSAVRAGDPLTPEQMDALVAERQLAGDTHHCPHGRPTSLLFSKQDLDRQFRRI